MDDERNIEKDAKESLGSIRPLLEEVRFSISTLTTEQDVEPDRWEELLHQVCLIFLFIIFPKRPHSKSFSFSHTSSLHLLTKTILFLSPVLCHCQ